MRIAKRISRAVSCRNSGGLAWLPRIVLAVLICGQLARADEAPSDRPPNVVLIVADDLGWTDLACYGSDYHRTPHLDALAARGMRFTAAYASPNCAPTRACLMTGQYTPRHGIYTVNTGARGRAAHRRLILAETRTQLPPELPTWADLLAEAGYFLGHIGKWHLGDPPTHGPEQHGFHVNVAGFRVGTPPGGYFPPYRNPYLEDGPAEEYLTDRLVDEAIAQIHQHRKRPFVIYLPHYAPHTPIQAPPELEKDYQDRPAGQHHQHAAYAAMIDSVDQGVGRILATLKDLELDQKTVVMFYSDNGGHQRFTSAHPLRGGKGMLYEGGVRVPLIVHWPGVTEPGSVCDEPVQHVDFFPTFLEIAGVESPADHPVDGLSFVPLLRSGGRGRLDREAIFWHFPGYLQGYLPGQRWRTTPAAAMRAGDWKLLEFFEDGRLELYHLADDLGEQQDLSDQHPQKRDALHAKMLQWRQELNAPMPEPVPSP